MLWKSCRANGWSRFGVRARVITREITAWARCRNFELLPFPAAHSSYPRSPELNASFFTGSNFILAATAIALIAAAALIVVVFRFLFGGRLRLPRDGRTRPARLGIVDAFTLDGKRQLVIVRRDNFEHLLMIGGPNDLVIESQFVRSESREPRGFREPKFRDKEQREKEWRELPPVPPSPAPAEAALPVASRHRAPPSQAAREGLPSELLEGVAQNWEPVLPPDAQEREELAQDDVARNSRLAFAEPPQAHAQAFAFRSLTPERREPLFAQKKVAERESAPVPAGPPNRHESSTTPAARAPRAPVATPLSRNFTQHPASDTVPPPSRAPEPQLPKEAGQGTGKDPEIHVEPYNADAAGAAQAPLQGRTDAADSSSRSPAAAPANERPHHSDSLELKMARLLGREP